MSNSQYVDGLESNAGVTLPNKAQLIAALDVGTMTRAQVLRNVVESQVVFDKYIIPAFVDMEYKGYLRREDMKSRALKLVDNGHSRPASPSADDPGRVTSYHARSTGQVCFQ